jgi:hypothetical protein
MGYSFYAIATSDKKHKKMLDFLAKHYRRWEDVIKDDHAFSHGFSDPHGGPCYCHHKLAIGFDFNGMGSERDYCFNVIRWVAVKVGKRRRSIAAQDGKYISKWPIPFVVYDGYDFWPIIIGPMTSAPKEWRWCVTDELGVKRGLDSLAGSILLEFGTKEDYEEINKFRAEHPERIFDAAKVVMKSKAKEVRKIIRNELKRLDELWRAET